MPYNTLVALFFHTSALALTLALGWLYLVGQQNYFFWIYPWFDVVLHLVGGMIMGLWACGVSAGHALSLRSSFIFLSIIVLAGSIAWEIFEQVLNLAGNSLDTLSDLLFGIAGALVVFLCYSFFRRSS